VAVSHDGGGGGVRSFLAAAAAAVPGMVAGIVGWTVLATVLLVVYWVGYEFLFLGFLCGTGKFGLGLFTPPSSSVQEAIRSWVLPLIAIAFTFGEIVAGLVGAVAGGTLGAVGMRLWSIIRRRTGEKDPSEGR
jgi:hypothetical protein